MDKFSNGFTLFELVMVMVLIGILAAVAAPRLGSLSGYDLTRAGHDLIEAIRYAQQQSMIHSGANDYQIAIGGSGFTVTQSGAAIPNPLDGSSSYSSNISEWSGITVTGGQTISFDSRGTPSCSATSCSEPSGSSVTITLTKSSESASITIEKFTGYAHLN